MLLSQGKISFRTNDIRHAMEHPDKVGGVERNRFYSVVRVECSYQRGDIGLECLLYFRGIDGFGGGLGDGLNSAAGEQEHGGRGCEMKRSWSAHENPP